MKFFLRKISSANKIPNSFKIIYFVKHIFSLLFPGVRLMDNVMPSERVTNVQPRLV